MNHSPAPEEITNRPLASPEKEEPGRRYWRLLGMLFATPPRWVEIMLWVLVIASAIGIRLYMVQIAPVAFWSEDAGSYTSSSFKYVHTGVWETDPRRGAIYSLFIAFVIKSFGSIHAVMLLQHFMGLFAIVSVFICLRIISGRNAIVPLACCCYAYAVLGSVLLMEHFIRNETLLLFFSSMTLCSWFLCLRFKAPAWLWVSGISVALLSLTKNVFFPFPFVVLLGALWFYRENRRFALKQVVYFLLAFLLPIVGIKTLNAVTSTGRPPAPQSGILLYGRTAQFTFLEGGIYPELKAIIWQDVEDYRALPKLNNNIIIYRTVIPKIRKHLYAAGKDTRDVDRVCRQLALEAIFAHPWAYTRQVLTDLSNLHFKTIKGTQTIPPRDIEKIQKTLRKYKNPDSILKIPEYLEALEPMAHPERFKVYNRWIGTSWLFTVGVVFITSCVLPFFIYYTRSSTRLWWIGIACVWVFTLVLLCTIGRPMNRYMIPVLPIIFWAVTSALIALWGFAARFVQSRNANQA